MQREIKNKVTILHAHGIGSLNKHGYKGISAFNRKFRAEITIGHDKKYLIGIFDTLEEAIKARKIAEQKKQEGCLKEWLATKPSGHSKAIVDFWREQFEMFE